MTKEENKSSSFFNHIKTYWVMYLFVLQMIITLTTNVNHIQNLETRVAALEKKQDATDAVLVEVRTRLASIETSLEFIKHSVSKLDDYNISIQ